MTSAAQAQASIEINLSKSNSSRPAFVVTDRTAIAFADGVNLQSQAGTIALTGPIAFAADLAEPGSDITVFVYPDGQATAFPWGTAPNIEGGGVIGGFHYAPGGNAGARAGGDTVPAINPYTCWDRNFRPACKNPRGLTLVEMPDGRLWWDAIYFLGVDHIVEGPSRYNARIADGADLPWRPDRRSTYPRLDYATACEIAAYHGMRLASVEERFVSLFGVTEKSAASAEPTHTGLDAPRTSQRGVMQATGNMYSWINDGDPDDPRASISGGSWLNGSHAGSRRASVAVNWPENSYAGIGLRLCSDHLTTA